MVGSKPKKKVIHVVNDDIAYITAYTGTNYLS